MKTNIYLTRSIQSLFALLIVVFLFGCPASNTSNHSNIEVQIIEKAFGESLCSDKVAKALNIKIKTQLLNTSEISGMIDYWKIDFYKEDKLLLMINKSNYKSYACGGQFVDMSDEIKVNGFFAFYGFTKYSLFNYLLPDKVDITLTIKDKSGHSYKINNTFK